MKIIKKWVDTNEKTTNYRYSLDNGMEFVHAVNPRSRECNFSVVVSGGMAFEEEIGVPQGTAHFLEHIIFGNPNNFLKTKDKFDSFTFGTKYRPGFSSNATTTRQYVYFYGHGNRKASKRILKYIYAVMNYPKKRIGGFIEKERNIILGELERMYKEDKDSGLEYDKLFIAPYYDFYKKKSYWDIRKY